MPRVLQLDAARSSLNATTPEGDHAPCRFRPSVLATVAAGLCAGLLATLVTNLAQRPLKAATPDRVELHERRIRPGETSSLMAARKMAACF